MPQRLFADLDRFPHETIEGETVAIDAERGDLFLFTGLGPWLWGRMAAGGSVDEVVGEAVGYFGDEAEASTREFLNTLVTHELLRSEPVAPGHDSDSMPDSLPGEPLPEIFQAPGLEHFDEIAAIVAMDPIHEVDPSAGWPHSKPPSSTNSAD